MGKVKKNFLMCLYGPEKVGKSTFASECPKPFFICAEDGTNELDVSRFIPKNWVEVKQILRELRDTDHEYKTVVFDTIDWLEDFQIAFLKQEHGTKTLKAIGGGYGAYVGICKSEWKNLFTLINEVRVKMNVLFLAHSHCKKFSDPIHSTEYDRYELKMEVAQAGNLFKEYVDDLLFTNYETTVRKDAQTNKTRAHGDKTRWVYTERSHAYDAGNRHGMPEEMELSASVVLKFLNRDDETINKDLLDQINALVVHVTDEKTEKAVKDTAQKFKDNPVKLKEVINRLKIKLRE
jgi:uncharacterized FlaG/YvyC family protein